MAEWNGVFWLACWKDLPQFYLLNLYNIIYIYIIYFLKENIPYVELIESKKKTLKTNRSFKEDLKKKTNQIPSPHGGASVIA